MEADMATPTPQPTRQQLDDLDALLQRMLALPVSPAGEPSPLATSLAESLAPPEGNLIVEEPLPPSPPPPAPLATHHPVHWPSESVSLPLLNPVPLAERRGPVLPPPDRPLTPRQALAASRPPRPPLLLRPVLWLNRLFDSTAFALGAPGRWLRRPTGRTLLGVVGLLLLAAAVALVVINRIGWTW
jgi:hypothetical protein